MNWTLRIMALSLASAAVVSAQPTKAQMLAITMPAPFYNVTKDLKYPGDYGYYTVGTLRQLPHQTTNLGSPSNWNWVRYTNSGNVRNVWAYGSAYNSGVCNHGHISYGLWAKYQYSYNGVVIRNWLRIAMSTQSGEMINGSCKWEIDNSFSRFAGEDFGWGTKYINSDIRTSPSYFKFTEYVLGGIVASHGGGNCGTFQCGHPWYAVLYSLN